jgi:hypothetical protein
MFPSEAEPLDLGSQAGAWKLIYYSSVRGGGHCLYSSGFNRRLLLLLLLLLSLLKFRSLKQ